MDERPDVLDGARPPEQTVTLFGHAAAEAFLAQSYAAGRLHHAILIEGPQGIGKASLAFRFAQHILNHPDPARAPEEIADPDPESSAYRQISAGASHNILHLARPVDVKTGKVKSAITVDEVRKAGKFFGQTSGTGNWRICIIDPADDLNRNAANAILKVLEEPPKRALFLVLSHAPGKLLPTIRSRCVTLRLDPLAPENLARALQSLPSPVSASEQVLALAEGSVSRALMLVNYGGADIAAAFDAIFDGKGAADRVAIHKLAETLSTRDRDVAYQFFVGHVLDRVQKTAVALAEAGDLNRAERFALLASALSEHFKTAEAYNLDRKQTVIHTFTLIDG